MDGQSLQRLEFDRVCARIAELAECEAARARLRARAPIADPAVRALAVERLAGAIRRQREPGDWCAVARGSIAALFAGDAERAAEPEGLLEALGWLEASRATRAAWSDPGLRERHAPLAALADQLPDLESLRAELDRSLDPDGHVRDAASPALARARRTVAGGERRLHARLERWAAAFGASAYVTRFEQRFVALVPAAGFPRRRGIVHDTSNSGQSLFVEPLEVCADNNELLEQRAAAAEEERRVLRALAAAVANARDALLATEEALAELDGLRAAARWACDLGGVAIAPAGETLRLVGARHPLLAMGERRDTVVPLDLELGTPGRLLLVSGPNMGGKTVLLKTVGTAVALAHAALPVLAAEGSRVPEIDEVLADLGDEQSVDQGLSTFAAHLRELRRMADAAGPRTLVLVDELGAGTDPEEGGALGRALVEHIAARGTWGVVTTHLGSMKRVAGEVAGVVNGSLEFDLETLSPRYRFQPGVPGASHALDVAGRLGFPSDVLARARTLAPEESRALERLLADVAAARRAADAERVALTAARENAEREAAHHRDAAEDAKRALADLRRRLTAESEALLGRARELWQTVQRDAKRADKSRADAGALRERLEAAAREADALQAAAAPSALGLPETAPPPGPLRIEPGARVRVLDLGIEAEVATAPDAEGRVSLRRGSFTIQSHVNRLAAAGPVAAAPSRAPVATFSGGDEPPPLEVDLRGLEVDEALRRVDEALDRAVVTGLTELRIVHGIGRGVLRAAVERHLRAHPQVESQRLGEAGEGGRGATVARLR